MSGIEPSRVINLEGKVARIYDDAFTFDERREFYNFSLNSLFNFISTDGIATAAEQIHYQISSQYNHEDVENMGFFAGDHMKHILEDNGCDLDRVKQFRINCSHMGEKNVTHSDGKGKTLIYCLNMNWRPEWSGHLMLMDESATDAREIIGFSAGRVSVFDGDIPHCLMTPNIMSPFHRLALVVQFHGIH